MDDYVVQKTDSSYCPRCDRTVHLLTPEFRDGPAFYICFPCKEVRQVGKEGLVKQGRLDRD